LAKPLVTVGLCVKDSENFIEETLSSLMNQNFPFGFIEVVVVDGCSRDRTIDIIKKYLSKKNIRYRIFCENQGLGAARQIVVDNARGEYIVWIDGDLTFSRDYIRLLVQLMNRNSNVGIAKGRISLTPGANFIATLEIYSRAAGKMIDFNSKIGTDSMGTAGCIYRTKAIRQVGGFDVDIKGYGEDWDAEYRIREAGWSLQTADVEYRDYERRGLTWKNVWHKYSVRGQNSRDYFLKNRRSMELYKWTPMAALISGFLHSLTLYKLTRRKIVFLLPIQHAFKMTAWFLGYLKC
jgi:glycosyltransferase involved in cell wall biosynthesis